MLTKAQIDQYSDVGYVVVEGVLSSAEVSELRSVTDRFVAGARGVAKNDHVYDLEETHTPDRPRVRRIKNPDRQHPAYAKLVRHPRIVEALCELWGPDVRFHGAKLNLKAAGYGAAVEWHQDWAFYPHTNEDLAAVGILMDDMVLANGPLMIVPGSHKGPLYDHHTNGAFVGAFDPRKAGLDMAKVAPMVGPAGSITIHHVRAIHGSALNTSERDRRLLLLQYRAADAWPLLAEEQPKSIADFDQMMVAGSPREPRLVGGLPIRIPRHSPTYVSGDGIYALQSRSEDKFFNVIEAPKTKQPQTAM